MIKNAQDFIASCNDNKKLFNIALEADQNLVHDSAHNREIRKLAMLTVSRYSNLARSCYMIQCHKETKAFQNPFFVPSPLYLQAMLKLMPDIKNFIKFLSKVFNTEKTIGKIKTSMDTLIQSQNNVNLSSFEEPFKLIHQLTKNPDLIKFTSDDAQSMIMYFGMFKPTIDKKELQNIDKMRNIFQSFVVIANSTHQGIPLQQKSKRNNDNEIQFFQQKLIFESMNDFHNYHMEINLALDFDANEICKEKLRDICNNINTMRGNIESLRAMKLHFEELCTNDVNTFSKNYVNNNSILSKMLINIINISDNSSILIGIVVKNMEKTLNALNGKFLKYVENYILQKPLTVIYMPIRFIEENKKEETSPLISKQTKTNNDNEIFLQQFQQSQEFTDTSQTKNIPLQQNEIDDANNNESEDKEIENNFKEKLNLKIDKENSNTAHMTLTEYLAIVTEVYLNYCDSPYGNKTELTKVFHDILKSYKSKKNTNTSSQEEQSGSNGNPSKIIQVYTNGGAWMSFSIPTKIITSLTQYDQEEFKEYMEYSKTYFVGKYGQTGFKKLVGSKNEYEFKFMNSDARIMFNEYGACTGVKTKKISKKNQ